VAQMSGMLMLPTLVKVAQLELDSFDNATHYAMIVGALGALALAVRWSAARLANSPEGELHFEEAEEPALFALDLHRDGVTPMLTPRS
jgi:hypothetical protein